MDTLNIIALIIIVGGGGWLNWQELKQAWVRFKERVKTAWNSCERCKDVRVYVVKNPAISVAYTLFLVIFIAFGFLFPWFFYFFIHSLYMDIKDQIDGVTIGSPAFRNVSLSIAGSITLSIAVLGLILTVIRNLLTRQQNRTDEQRVITEQISRAIDQIGSYKQNIDGSSHEPNIEARVGGIYSLERIAKNSVDDYKKIMDILCAYVRVTAPIEESESAKEESESENPKIKIREDIQAAIDVLGTKKGALMLWNRDKFRVNLENCDLSNSRFSELNFNRGADSNNGTIFDDSLFEQSEFHGADLSYVSFDRATLTEANLEYAKLKGARFLGAIFKDTKVHGADFSKAKKLTQEQVNEMIGDTDTKLPNGLKLSRIEESPKLKKS